MDVLADGPRLSIPRDAAVVGYSRGGEGLTGRVVGSVPVGAASVGEIVLWHDAWRDDFSCAVCAGLDRVGLLRRVPIGDAPILRADRVVLTCSACRAAFVRMDGKL